MEIRLINISKRYQTTDDKYVASLDMINLDINYGNYTSFVGPSGSGKTTLLKILTGNLKPSHGDVFWGKNSLSKSADAVLASIRRKKFGIVFQDVNFMNELSVEDNILLPLVINYTKISDKLNYYQKLVDSLNIERLKKRYPYELSGGEKKKVAIARSLITNPEILIADEPTSNLDETSAKEVFNIFSNLNKLGLTIVLATHDERFGLYCRETYYMKDGKIAHFTKRDEKE